MRGLLKLAAGVAVAAAGVVGFRLIQPDRGQYEEPAYTVLETLPGFEVREYGPSIQARITLPGTRSGATQQGFGALAGYIFGGNRAKQSIDMTSPVAAAPASQSIDMTTPVSASPSGAGWTVAFTMPSSWTLETLPEPNDGRIELVAVPGHVTAVRTFSGRATQRTVEREERALADTLAAAGRTSAGPVTLAQFDPPWVLGPWRRNELQVPVVSL